MSEEEPSSKYIQNVSSRFNMAKMKTFMHKIPEEYIRATKGGKTSIPIANLPNQDLEKLRQIQAELKRNTEKGNSQSISNLNKA
jgi:hypothetical protein